jgi:hypothetical protein
MAQKKIGLVGLLVFFALSNLWSQSCPIFDKYIKYRTRKYYVLDTGDSTLSLSLSEVIQNIKSRDTSLVQELIKKGTIYRDYVAFFRQKGISVKLINYDQFVALPFDTVILTKRESRLRKKYDRLWEKENAVRAAEKYDRSLERKINKMKFEHLHEKLLTQNPYLFIMYPIYKYNANELIMYVLKGCRSCEGFFTYEICDTNFN